MRVFICIQQLLKVYRLHSLRVSRVMETMKHALHKQYDPKGLDGHACLTSVRYRNHCDRPSALLRRGTRDFDATLP